MVEIVALIHGRPGGYGISFPDFPGCIAGGDTIDEALHRGRDGLEFHMQSMKEVGELLPKIRNIAEITDDAAHADDFVDAIVVDLVDCRG